jgi:acetyltransferase-like isoleucine patch superfamily enzyme
VRGRVFVDNEGQISIGDRVRINARTVPVELAASKGAELLIGRGTYLNYGTSISSQQSVKIGANCLIGNYVNIMDGDFHDLHDHTLPGKIEPVVIEDDVWLGVRSVVLKGVTVGRGSVIGAGSVVTRDVPPGSLAFGVPAQVVRQL